MGVGLREARGVSELVALFEEVREARGVKELERDPLREGLPV